MKRSEGIDAKTDEEPSEIKYERTRRENFRAAKTAGPKNDAHTFGAVEIDAARCERVAIILQKLQKSFMQVTAYIEQL